MAGARTGEAEERARLLEDHGRRVAAGERLFEEGAPAREAFLLEEGRVRLLRRVAMSDRSLAVVKPGELFGEAALLPEAAHGSTAVSLVDGLVLALDRETFGGLVGSHPAMAALVVEQLVRRLHDAEDQIEILMLRGVQSKVTSALLKLAPTRQAGRTAESAAIVVSPSELSTRVGLDVETVKRVVLRLREQEYLRIQGDRIEIPDVEALRRLVVLFGARDELAGPGSP